MAQLIGQQNKKGLNSLIIRLCGLLLMALDYMFTYFPNTPKLALCLEWAAFPIFAFLLAEGVNHTSDFRLYLRRFSVFAVLSEFAYDFLFHGKLLEFTDQNPMFTLLAGLLCIKAVKTVREKLNNTVVTGLLIAALCWISYFVLPLLKFSMGKYAMIVMMIFYISTVVTYKKIFQLISLGLLIGVIASGWIDSPVIGGYIYSVPSQILMLAVLPLIWAYNGKRGPNDMGVKIFFYCIYPMSMLLIGIIKIGFK